MAPRNGASALLSPGYVCEIRQSLQSSPPNHEIPPAENKQSFVFNHLHSLSRLGIEVADVSVKAPSGEQGP
jgi:hypothetical protein